VDSWIWSVRLTRTRSAASGACRAGHVRVNGIRVKPAHAVRAGDEVRLHYEGRDRVVVVQRVITKRAGASVAAECYIDKSPPPPPREEAVAVAARDRGAGRPTKRERRSMEKFLGRSAR
jgi:ribosome-associated heat shock protein Hsp15